jgi:hypothetical protein
MIQANQQTTTIDTWPYYEFEDYIKILNDRNEEEKKAQEEQNEKQNTQIPNMNQISNLTNNFKMPNMPKI